MIKQLSENFMKEQQNLKSNKKYLRPSQKISGCCSSSKFDSRFQQMKLDISNRSFISVMCSFICYSLKNQKVNVPTNTKQLEYQLPMSQPNFTPSPDLIKYTWIGHSTAVISLGQDATIMIDPVFSERCSPVSFAGPKRYRPPACQIKDLPQIDAIFVSHDHYDHLDDQSLQKLYDRNNQTLFFAGLQSQKVFPKNCKIKTLDWTEKYNFEIRGKNFKVTFVPVCHWARRGMFDKNQRLWGGFVIQSPTGKKIFYAGDTGYCDIFKQIGNYFQSIDLAILPIGAYLPRQMLRYQHIDPQQAVIIHKELRSKKSVGVHWGTFSLGMEHYLAPQRDLQKAKQKHGLNQDEFVAIGHGEALQIKY